MNRMPPRACCMTLRTLFLVSPTYCPCSPVPEVTTTLSEGSSPRFLKSCPNLLATVVFPVPGGPVKTMWLSARISAGSLPSALAATMTASNSSNTFLMCSTLTSFENASRPFSAESSSVTKSLRTKTSGWGRGAAAATASPRRAASRWARRASASRADLLTLATLSIDPTVPALPKLGRRRFCPSVVTTKSTTSMSSNARPALPAILMSTCRSSLSVISSKRIPKSSMLKRRRRPGLFSSMSSISLV
mmetsp:Transcript_69356/g.184986  ORF Transcript_69356/g.184986 Transcript_69356/m.184986 type:complete len:247 (+) Transcript_69356:1618-2358(+)